MQNVNLHGANWHDTNLHSAFCLPAFLINVEAWERSGERV
jgi:hypothetical protein